MKKVKIISGLVAGICLSAAMSASADTVRVSGGSVQVTPSGFVKNMTLSVSGPNGFHVQEYSESRTPRVSLMQNGQLADGIYQWNMTASTNEVLPRSLSTLDDGRGEIERPQQYKGTSSSGMFVIAGGVLVQPDINASESDE